jgi:catechol 2,3-dioxygenase
MTDRLAADTAMGPVTLDVAALDLMTRYYRDAVGLDVLSAAGGDVTLGRGTVPVMHLRHSPELRHAAHGQAVLFDTQAALAGAVYRVATAHPASFTGSSDHLVSQAFYFNDPELNGVELYWDRDRTQWSWVHGHVEMATIFLDPNRFLQEHLTQEALDSPHDSKPVVGHVHLSVGDVESAREFYVNRLGFETTAEFGDSALFVSAGGYHHHMAMNVWNSAGAGRRARTLGLGAVDIVVPTADEVGALTERMKHFGVDARDDGRTVELEDPWANLVRVTAAA